MQHTCKHRHACTSRRASTVKTTVCTYLCIHVSRLGMVAVWVWVPRVVILAVVWVCGGVGVRWTSRMVAPARGANLIPLNSSPRARAACISSSTPAPVPQERRKSQGYHKKHDEEDNASRHARPQRLAVFPTHGVVCGGVVKAGLAHGKQRHTHTHNSVLPSSVNCERCGEYASPPLHAHLGMQRAWSWMPRSVQ